MLIFITFHRVFPDFSHLLSPLNDTVSKYFPRICSKAMLAETKKIPLEEWVRRLNEEEMPVFAHTARSIAAVSGKLDTPVAELSHLILQDSAMTTRVLRLANSVYYNPANKDISTVSLAILMLGFDVVRSIALSIAMIDTILKGVQHEHVVEEMARALHAAVQAKTIASARGISEVEEVFIAALLCRLGHLAFWCFPQDLARELDAEYCVSDSEEKAEKKILGFTLTDLTLALNEEWHLSHLLKEYLSAKDVDTTNTSDVDYAYQLVMSIEEGWGSIAVRKAIEHISRHTALSWHDTLDMVQKSAKLAAQTAIEYGAINASKLINLPDNVDLSFTDNEHSENAYEPNLSLQMSILRELTTMLSQKVDLNAVLGTVLEGVYRALGMDRTVLAFLNEDNTVLKAKYVYGQDRISFQHCFNFQMETRTIFGEILQSREPFWLNFENQKKYESLLTADIKKCIGTLDFMVMPLFVGEKGKGVIYADCKLSGRKITEQDFNTFIHFCENANIALELLTIRRN